MKALERTFRRAVVITLAAVMLTGLGAWLRMPAFTAAADDDEYTYTITVYSGKEGSFSGGAHTKRFTGLKYGESFTVNLSSLGLTVADSDTYYVRGLKIAGHDNDEIAKRNYQSYNFKVTGDESFSVAYGMTGGMVKYVVRYVDENDTSLIPDEEYYGMPGDYPVVSYQYVEGYMPDAYNKGKTLSDNVDDNVFLFHYTKIGETTTPDNGDNGDNDGNNANNGTAGANNANAGNAGANNAGNAGTNAANAGNANNGPADFVDLDNSTTPLAPGADGQNDGDGTDIDDSKTPLSSPVIIGSVAALLILIALLAFFLARRKREKEDEE